MVVELIVVELMEALESWVVVVVGMPAGAGLVVVFTLIGDGVSGGVGEASSISPLD